jgi:beclin 1
MAAASAASGGGGGGASEPVEVMCARCGSRLLELELAGVDVSALELTTAEAPPPGLGPDFRDLERQAAAALAESYHVVPASIAASAAASTPAPAAAMHRRMMALTKLFELQSDRSGEDFPLCTSCVESLERQMQQRFKDLVEDKKLFADALARLRVAPPARTAGATSSPDSVAREKQLLESLNAVRRERAALAAEQSSLLREAQQMDALERKLWEAHAVFQYRAQQLSQEHVSLSRSVAAVNEQLQRLSRTNVLDDVFHISRDGFFGTINGFRLGRLQSVQVDWSEINAALGQVALLLNILSAKMSHPFEQYRILPQGSSSRIQLLKDNSAYDLFFDESRFFASNTSFNNALGALLECVGELGRVAEQRDPSFKPAHRVREHTIDELSVKSYNDTKEWTRALLFMLENIKLLVAFDAKNPDR